MKTEKDLNETSPTGIRAAKAPGYEEGLKEIDLGFVASTIKSYRWWMLACSTASLLLGMVYAFIAAPVYMSVAVISPKELEKRGGASSLLSQFGGIGGIVASQFGMGNANLDKMEIMLLGHELAETVIEKNNLMPILFRKKWDAEKDGWRSENPQEQPTIEDAIEMLQNSHIAASVNAKKGVLTVQGYFNDPETARRLVGHYLDALNERIRSDVIMDAERNRKYLESQLMTTQDPIFREKLNNLISYELEKSMLVSHQSFDIISKPTKPLRTVKPKRKIIAIVSLFGGVFVAFMSALFMNVVKQAGASSKKDERMERIHEPAASAVPVRGDK